MNMHCESIIFIYSIYYKYHTEFHKQRKLQLNSDYVQLGYVYTSQLYCSKTETVAAKKLVNNWLQ